MSDAIVSYAALILADSDKEITSESLQAVISAAGATVDHIWTETFAKALEGQDVKEALFASSANAAPAAGSAPAAGAASSESAAAEEAEEEEEEEESDDDMGMGLFD